MAEVVSNNLVDLQKDLEGVNRNIRNATLIQNVLYKAAFGESDMPRLTLQLPSAELPLADLHLLSEANLQTLFVILLNHARDCVTRAWAEAEAVSAAANKLLKEMSTQPPSAPDPDERKLEADMKEMMASERTHPTA